jgi:hypothetical protein
LQQLCSAFFLPPLFSAFAFSQFQSKWLKSSLILQASIKHQSLHPYFNFAKLISQPKQAKIQFLILSNRYRNSSSLSINLNKQKSVRRGIQEHRTSKHRKKKITTSPLSSTNHFQSQPLSLLNLYKSPLTIFKLQKITITQNTTNHHVPPKLITRKQNKTSQQRNKQQHKQEAETKNRSRTRRKKRRFCCRTTTAPPPIALTLSQ